VFVQQKLSYKQFLLSPPSPIVNIILIYNEITKQHQRLLFINILDLGSVETCYVTVVLNHINTKHAVL